jgi:hypothetical protein
MDDDLDPKVATAFDPIAEEEDLVDGVRSALGNDPERLKRVAQLLLDSGVDDRVIHEKRTKENVETDAAKRWALFKKRLGAVASFGAAQDLVDAVPRGAALRERLFYTHLGKFLQTRKIPEAASADERAELGALLVRISDPQKP